MAPPFFDDEAFRSFVSFEAATEVLEATFSGPLPAAPQRSALGRNGGQFLLMPSWGEDALGIKLVTVKDSNPARGLPLIHALYVLFSAETLEPVAIFSADALTAIRTAALSALATKHLAPAGADRLLVFGSGVQAEAHIRALSALRRIREIVIVAREVERGRALIELLAAEGITARIGAPEDVAGADLVCTCTTSSVPVLDGRLLRAGTHVNAIGAHTPETREVDSTTVARAWVVVETRAAALAEAGDLLIPLAEGSVSPDRVPAADLAEVIRGTAAQPTGDITLFKSVGVGFEDLALARFAYERIRTAGPQKG